MWKMVGSVVVALAAAIWALGTEAPAISVPSGSVGRNQSCQNAETSDYRGNGTLDVRVMLYRSLGSDPINLLLDQKLNLEAPLDAGLPTKVLIHGFNMDLTFAEPFVTEYLRSGQYNVVAVDYSHLVALESFDSYSKAAPYAVDVGRILGDLFGNAVLKAGLNPADVHVIGYSMGAHVAAHMARRILNTGRGKLGRISGLDPARPWFEDHDPQLILNKGDAEFVDIIHTNSGLFWEGCFSWMDQMGHVDFYPNGGRHQPGCNELCLGWTCTQIDMFDIGGCSHSKAVSYFLESISSEKVGFLGVACDTWENFVMQRCSFEGQPTLLMGEPGSSGKVTRQGRYYLYVNQEAPFALGPKAADSMAAAARNGLIQAMETGGGGFDLMSMSLWK